MGDEKDNNMNDDNKDRTHDGGKHRDEDNTRDGSHNRPIPPRHEPNRHDR